MRLSVILRLISIANDGTLKIYFSVLKGKLELFSGTKLEVADRSVLPHGFKRRAFSSWYQCDSYPL